MDAPAAPDPKLLAVQARAQVDAAIASHQARLQQQKTQNDAIHLQVKTQGEIELAKIKAALDVKMTLLETHVKSAIPQADAHRATYPYSGSVSQYEQFHGIPYKR
jgi:hypothetical protein